MFQLKMNKIIVVLVLYAASASCVKLANLCSSDIFTYNGLAVNAFYRAQSNITFKPLGHYLIEDSVKCDENEFRNKSNLQEALRLKQA